MAKKQKVEKEISLNCVLTEVEFSYGAHAIPLDQVVEGGVAVNNGSDIHLTGNDKESSKNVSVVVYERGSREWSKSRYAVMEPERVENGVRQPAEQKVVKRQGHWVPVYSGEPNLGQLGKSRGAWSATLWLPPSTHGAWCQLLYLWPARELRLSLFAIQPIRGLILVNAAYLSTSGI